MRPSVATADLQVLGHILDTGCAHDSTGRTVVWTSRLKEQVVLAVTSLQFAHCPNKQTNNCFTLSATHAEPSAVKGAPIFFYHCVALVVVTIYTNIQISVGWLFFGFEEV